MGFFMKFNITSSKMFAPNVHGVSKIVSHFSPDDSSMSGLVLLRSIGWNLEGSDEELDVLTFDAANFWEHADTVSGSIGEGNIIVQLPDWVMQEARFGGR